MTLTALELQCRILLPHPTLTKSIFSASEDKTGVQKQCNVYYLCLHLGDHGRAMEGQDEGAMMEHIIELRADQELMVLDRNFGRRVILM